MYRVIQSVLTAAAVMALGTTYSIAATLTWTGVTGNGHLADPANWLGGVAPTASERLSFPLNVSLFTVLMDGDMTFQGIDVFNQSVWSISGGTLTLTSTTPITMTNFGALSLPGNVRLAAASPTISVTEIIAGGGGLVFGPSGSLTVSGGTVHVEGANSEIDFLGPINETAPTSLQVSGNVVALLSNPGNTFTGNLAANGPDAKLQLQVSGAAGAISQLSVSQGSINVFDSTQRVPDFVCAGVFAIEVGTGKFSVTQHLDVASCLLTLRILASPTPGTTYTIIENLTGNAFPAPLLGWPSGYTLPINGVPMTVTYQAGAGGHDFALVTAPAPVIASLQVVVGDQQTLFVGQTAPLGFFVRAFDSAGHVMGGVPVRFTSNCVSFGGAASVDAITNVVSGEATPGAFTALTPGICMAHAQVIGSTLGADITVHISDPSSTPPPFTMTTRLQDMWWAGPAGNGWGMSLMQHNDTLAGAMYIYDANGKPTWLFMPGGAWDSTHTIYTGSLYTPSGSPFFAYDTSRWVAGNANGSVTITFQDANNAILDYTIGGISGRKLITREIFALGGPTLPDRSDLWWGGTAQNGWGITILQQASTLFPMWFTYDANGVATWYAMPGGTWTASDTYEGRVYRTTGSPWVGHDYDPTQLQVFDVGAYRIQFTGDSASFTYAIDSHSGTIPLVREPF